MAAGVLHEGVRGVEAHGLGVEQGGAERRRVPALQPRRRVDEVGEAHRVALGEAVAGEGGQLLPDDLDDLGGDAALGGPVGEALVQPLHALAAALGAHGLAEHVGLAGAEAAHVDGHLHELLLEERHAERLLQRWLQQRVEVGDAPPARCAAGCRGAPSQSWRSMRAEPALDRRGIDQLRERRPAGEAEVVALREHETRDARLRISLGRARDPLRAKPGRIDHRIDGDVPASAPPKGLPILPPLLQPFNRCVERDHAAAIFKVAFEREHEARASR